MILPLTAFRFILAKCHRVPFDQVPFFMTCNAPQYSITLRGLIKFQKRVLTFI